MVITPLPGRTLTVCAADVFGISGDTSRLVATMLSTIIIRPLGQG